MYPKILDFSKIKTYSLEEKKAEIFVKDIINPDNKPAEISPDNLLKIIQCSNSIKVAKHKDAGINLMFGGHLIKNLGGMIVNDFIREGWVNCLSGQGSVVIHDLELALIGQTSESVRENIKLGKFGAWTQMSESIYDALYGKYTDDLDYQRGMGELIGRYINLNKFPHKYASTLACAEENEIPYSIHLGIGYDCFSVSPFFDGRRLGHRSGNDFKLFCSYLYENLENGVVLVVGSAVMAGQIFEKALSIVNNIRIQEGKGPTKDFDIYVVDLQDTSGHDWNTGEPAKTDPDYYLRFMKSFSRMGQRSLTYIQEDNVRFLHNLHHILVKGE